jgi:hypothetical protein
MEVYKKGQHVKIEMQGKSINATVMIASPNGVSLMVAFDGALGGVQGGIYMGMMPIMYDEDMKCFKDLIADREVKISLLPPTTSAA